MKQFSAGQRVEVRGHGTGTVTNDSRGRNTVNVRGQNWADIGPTAFPVEWVTAVHMSSEGCECEGCARRKEVAR